VPAVDEAWVPHQVSDLQKEHSAKLQDVCGAEHPDPVRLVTECLLQLEMRQFRMWQDTVESNQGWPHPVSLLLWQVRLETVPTPVRSSHTYLQFGCCEHAR
jgi:hypothetical protein